MRTASFVDPELWARLRARADMPPLRGRVPLRAGAAVVGSVEPDLFNRIDLKPPSDGRFLLFKEEQNGTVTGWVLTGDVSAGLNALALALHQAGLEVVLDVVFNHTGESDVLGPVLSFRGLDNAAYAQEPFLDAKGQLGWRDAPLVSGDDAVLRPTSNPFSADGGLRRLTGNLGRAVIKVSAVKPEHRIVEAPARVFDSQEAVQAAFKRGELRRDFIAVVRFQGPRANGMPELHKLTPPLAVLQGKGFRVALVTDGRMSGASGKVPAAIHVSPEAVAGGPLARLRDGDVIRLDANAGSLQVLVSDAEWTARPVVTMPDELRAANGIGMGRELFANFRRNAWAAEEGACTWL